MSKSYQIDVIKAKKAKKRYDFFVDDQVIASVDYPKRYEKKAVLGTPDRQWEIHRKGWWKPSIEIVSAQSPYTKWSLPQSWRHTVSLRADDNRAFVMKQRSFWSGSLIWVNDKDETVIEIKPYRWSYSNRGTITITDKNDTNLIFLALIGWFLFQTAREDAAAAI
ncbi:MAG: hypothetical protein H7Y31_15810 [Chitinophagaceae bacterium]|nr:hypothetical protein [Chitinophagaceae bacterium]